tara:strand:+ start:57 stop:1139 length:1083 start_codon:yes stop_codon:yes gene_type:complete
MQNLNAVSIDEVTNDILVGGALNTILVEGHMGTGKSSILKVLAEKLPNHTPCYFDATTKDIGDLMIPKFKDLDGQDYVTYATNEELGIHTGKPIICMVDEFGKANPSVRNGLLCFLQERKMGGKTLHPDSIVFATTNLGAEGVGDILMPHQCNRLTIKTMRKPDAQEWIEWALNNEVDHSLLSWVRETPQCMQSFEEVNDPQENPYIFHPREIRRSFVTPRSLVSASNWLKLRHLVSENSLQSSIAGCIGARAGADMMAYVRLADQMPKLDDIKKNPLTAPVPRSPAAVCMVVYRSLSTLTHDWVNAWVDYVERLEPEAQAMFANAARATKYNKRDIVLSNKKFGTWARNNAHLFTADQV